MDGSKCILQVRGVRPFFSDKYDIESHKHYRLLSDFSPKNTFNLEKYLNRKLVVKPDDEFEHFEHIPVDMELPTETFADFTEYEHDLEDYPDDFELV